MLDLDERPVQCTCSITQKIDDLTGHGFICSAMDESGSKRLVGKLSSVLDVFSSNILQ